MKRKQKFLFRLASIYAVINILMFSAQPEICRGEIELVKVGEASLFDVCSLSEKKYIAVGDFGSIYTTADGGKTWSDVYVKNNPPLYSIKKAGKNLFISGACGIILKSEDEGRTWIKLQSKTEKHLFCLDCINDENCIAVGDWGTIFRTEDGGQTWENVSLEEDRMLYGISYAGNDHIWIAGEMGLIVNSKDGGKTWQEVSSPAESTFTAVNFENAEQGFVVGIDGMAFETKDGGENWDVINGLPSEHYYNVTFGSKRPVCIGNHAVVVERQKSGWVKWKIPVDYSILWLSGMSIDYYGNSEVTLIAGKKGLLIKNIRKVD